MKPILKRTLSNELEMSALVQEFKTNFLENLENFSCFFEGGLGAGKTFFVRSLLKSFNISGSINSPTYTYVQEYAGDKNFAHFDLYRFTSSEDFLAKGFGEIIEDETVCKLVEWPNKISTEILEEFSGTKFLIKISHGQKDTERNLEIFSI